MKVTILAIDFDLWTTSAILALFSGIGLIKFSGTLYYVCEIIFSISLVACIIFLGDWIEKRDELKEIKA